MSSNKTREIKLSKLLKEKSIDLQLRETQKRKVMEELVDLIALSGKLDNKSAFLRAIWERENLGSTGIGAGIAIPHAKAAGIRNFVLVFARSDRGIDFGALDGEKTYLFFALASPKEEVGGHLKILAGISHLVKDKFMIELLRKAKNKKEIISIISRAERLAAK